MNTFATAADETFFGDGFIPYHLAVHIQNPLGDKDFFQATVATIKELKTFVRGGLASELTPECLYSRIASMPDTVSVVAEGAYSSIIIPLAMIRSLRAARTVLHGVVGTGPITNAIEQSLGTHGIEFVPKRIPGGDSVIEISVRDAFGHQKTIRLYPLSRTKYRQTFAFNDADASPAAGFVLSRYNAGRADAFRRVAAAGGITSLRIAAPSRYVSIDDYLSLLPYASQTIVSHRDGVLKKLGKRLLPGITKGRWTDRCSAESTRLTQTLIDRAGDARLVVVILETELIFAMRGYPQLRFRPPPHFDHRSRAARVQGACAAIFRAEEIASDGDWIHLAEMCVQAAYRGSESRPSLYPHPFAAEPSWQIA